MMYLAHPLPQNCRQMQLHETRRGNRRNPNNTPLITTLEKLHYRALTLLLGCRKTTSEFACLQEAGILPIKEYALLRIGALRERMRHQPGLWRGTLERPSALKEQYASLCKKAGTDVCKREAHVFNPFAPWSPRPRATINPSLSGKRDDPPAVKKQIVETQLRRLGPPDCSVWIDGSVLDTPTEYPPPSDFDIPRPERHHPWMKRHADKTKWGGAGMYFVFEESIAGNIRDHTTLDLTTSGSQQTATCARPVGKHAHSYRAEQVAMHAALVLLTRHLSPTATPFRIHVLSDSQSFLTTLSSGPHLQVQPAAIQCWLALARLADMGYLVTLQFVYAHCGLDGNDRADELAKWEAVSLSRQTATHLIPAPYPLSVADAINRYKTYLRLDSYEKRALAALDGAEGRLNFSSFTRIVAGRPIPRRRHLTTWAEREVRQLRTGHHGLIMALYSPDWHTLSNTRRRMHFLPCPICSAWSSSPLVHLFFNCTDSATQHLRTAWIMEVMRREGKHPGLPTDSLWYVLFAHPELALLYLQRAGVLPSYAVLLNSDSEDANADAAAPVLSNTDTATSLTPEDEQHTYGLVPILSNSPPRHPAP